MALSIGVDALAAADGEESEGDDDASSGSASGTAQAPSRGSKRTTGQSSTRDFMAVILARREWFSVKLRRAAVGAGPAV
jgi:hypothetical protein